MLATVVTASATIAGHVGSTWKTLMVLSSSAVRPACWAVAICSEAAWISTPHDNTIPSATIRKGILLSRYAFYSCSSNWARQFQSCCTHRKEVHKSNSVSISSICAVALWGLSRGVSGAVLPGLASWVRSASQGPCWVPWLPLTHAAALQSVCLHTGCGKPSLCRSLPGRLLQLQQWSPGAGAGPTTVHVAVWAQVCKHTGFGAEKSHVDGHAQACRLSSHKQGRALQNCRAGSLGQTCMYMHTCMRTTCQEHGWLQFMASQRHCMHASRLL